MPGPAPQRNARRKNARPEWRTLPSQGRSGAPPKWPLTAADRRVKALWVQLWSSPQSVAWEDLGWTRVVARYAQVLLVCEGPQATAAMLGEARQLEDRLGLSPMAMKRLQWEIDRTASVEQETPAEVTRLSDYRDL